MPEEGLVARVTALEARLKQIDATLSALEHRPSTGRYDHFADCVIQPE